MGNCWGAQVLFTSRSSDPEPLIDPLDDDAYFNGNLRTTVLSARGIVGSERYVECLRRLQRSDRLIAACVLEAAEAKRLVMFRDDIDSDSDDSYNSRESYLVG